MKETKELENKIANRDTELHRYYDMLLLDEENIADRKAYYLLELSKLDDKAKHIIAEKAKCQKRAAEQGYPESL